MAFEFLGMSGTILYAFIIAAILLANWKLSKKEFLKFIPVSRFGLGVLGILIMIGVGSSTAWWGYGELAVPVVPDEPDVTPGVTFEVKASESDANLAYDSSSRVLTCSFYENLESAAIETAGVAGGAPGSAITTLTFTVTLYRTDFMSENGITQITSSIPSWMGKVENAGITYYPIDLDTTVGEFRLAMTPSGGSARNEETMLAVEPGASKAISIVATLSTVGLCQLDNAQSKDTIIYTPGGNVILRLTKVGEQL